MYNPWDSEKKDNNNQAKRGTIDKLPINGSPKMLLMVVLVGAFLLWMASGFYQVDLGSVAVVTRFGKIVQTTEAGWHYRLPAPIDRVYRCNPSIVQQINVSRNGDPSSVLSRTDAPDTSLSHTITGDRNLVDVSYTVQWRISDPIRFLFYIDEAEQLIRLTSESVMRDAINSIDIDEALAEGRHKIESSVKEYLQKILDSYEVGVLIHEVTLRRLDPPKEVVEAFYDVEKAWADHHYAVNQAEAFSNEEIPRARAKSAKITEKAKAFAYDVMQSADAESSAFGKILHECRKGRFGGERFLLYEALKRSLKDKKIVLIDGALPSGILPLMSAPAGLMDVKERHAEK